MELQCRKDKNFSDSIFCYYSDRNNDLMRCELKNIDSMNVAFYTGNLSDTFSKFTLDNTFNNTLDKMHLCDPSFINAIKQLEKLKKDFKNLNLIHYYYIVKFIEDKYLNKIDELKELNICILQEEKAYIEDKYKYENMVVILYLVEKYKIPITVYYMNNDIKIFYKNLEYKQINNNNIAGTKIHITLSFGNYMELYAGDSKDNIKNFFYDENKENTLFKVDNDVVSIKDTEKKEDDAEKEGTLLKKLKEDILHKTESLFIVEKYTDETTDDAKENTQKIAVFYISKQGDEFEHKDILYKEENNGYYLKKYIKYKKKYMKLKSA